MKPTSMRIPVHAGGVWKQKAGRDERLIHTKTANGTYCNEKSLGGDTRVGPAHEPNKRNRYIKHRACDIIRHCL